MSFTGVGAASAANCHKSQANIPQSAFQNLKSLNTRYSSLSTLLYAFVPRCLLARRSLERRRVPISLFPFPLSPFTFHYPLSTIHYPLSTVHYSLFTVYQHCCSHCGSPHPPQQESECKPSLSAPVNMK
jgi:hypothetical protein